MHYKGAYGTDFFLKITSFKFKMDEYKMELVIIKTPYFDYGSLICITDYQILYCSLSYLTVKI